jgi:hypothetical protein
LIEKFSDLCELGAPVVNGFFTENPESSKKPLWANSGKYSRSDRMEQTIHVERSQAPIGAGFCGSTHGITKQRVY